MKPVAFFILSFAIEVSFGEISLQCIEQIRDASECALGPIRSCFTRNGCDVPDSPPPFGGSGPRNCIHELLDRAVPYVQECMNVEFPGVPNKFLHMTKQALSRMSFTGRPGEMQAELKGIVRQMIAEECGSAAGDVEDCLEEVDQEGTKQRIQRCMSQVSNDCKQEMKAAMCRCIQSTLDRDPTLLSDGIECARNSGRVPPALHFLLNENTVRHLISRFCNSSRIAASRGKNVLRDFFQRMRAHHRRTLTKST